MTLVSSPDGQWVATRRGNDVALLAAGHAPPVGQLALEHDDVDLALVGPPVVLVAVSRHADGTTVVLHQPPYLDAVARLDLEAPYHLAAITGPRMALVSKDAKQVTIVRAAGRALSAQAIAVGGPVELSVGLDRNQLLFAILRKLEVWDAVSGRPLLRLQLQLPPPPRTVGAAAGHLWTTRPDSDEIFVYRMSDGRPFRHQAGAPIERVICHPASPVLVLVTPLGLVRLHCLAHALTAIEVPWPPAGDASLVQLVAGDDIQLLGLGDGPEPWRIAITGSQPAVAEAEPLARHEGESAIGSMMRSRGRSEPAPRPPRAPAWRDAVAGYGLELSRGGEAETPVVAVDTELGELAHRFGLSATARRTLIAVYGGYLAGERLPIVRIARAVADWNEPLGHGELGALGMISTHDGRVVLSASVVRLLDGFSPRAIRIVDRRTRPPSSGVTRVDRADRTDDAIESALADQLGRIAIVVGHVTTAMMEARFVGATAIVLQAPAREPAWPRDANVVVIAEPDAPAWVTALPELTASSPAPAS